MAKLRVKRLLCLHCFATLTSDDREHYVYQCHACVLIEHDQASVAKTDPDHPDARRLSDIPVLVD